MWTARGRLHCIHHINGVRHWGNGCITNNKRKAKWSYQKRPVHRLQLKLVVTELFLACGVAFIVRENSPFKLQMYCFNHLKKKKKIYSILNECEHEPALSAKFPPSLTCDVSHPARAPPPCGRSERWSAERSLGIKRGFCRNPVNDWILADTRPSVLSNHPLDAKCSRWQLRVIHSPLNDLVRREKRESGCALASEPHDVFQRGEVFIYGLTPTLRRWRRCLAHFA